MGTEIFDARSWRTDQAQRVPCAMTESQIFSHPARPNLDSFFVFVFVFFVFYCVLLLR